MLPLAAGLPEDLDRYFATTVGLVTTHSSAGDNVMAAEWSFNISYEPMRVAIFISPRRSTHGAIAESKEFGLNLAADEQFALASFAGGFSHREAHKLTSGAIRTRPGEAIGARMIEGSLAQIECKLVATFVGGDHTEFVGEVVAARVDPAKSPLILYRGYHRLGGKIPRGAQLFLTLTPEGDGGVRADGLYYADQREAQRVALEAFDPTGAKVAEGEAVTDRGGFFEWRTGSAVAVRAVGRVADVVGEALR